MIKFLFLLTFTFAATNSAGTPANYMLRQTARFVPSVAGFSGASSAHRKGNYGDGQTAIVIEAGYRTPSIFRDLGKSVHFFPDVAPPPPIDHYEAVINVIQQVAPSATIVAANTYMISNESQLNTAVELNPKLDDLLKNATAINLSLTTGGSVPSSVSAAHLDTTKSIVESIEEISNRYGRKKLVVVSAGNDASNLSLARTNKKRNANLINNLLKSKKLQQKIIVVGSIDSYRTLAHFSAVPGHRETLQKNFLTAFGQGIWIQSAEQKTSGTSVSAPTVTGATLLIKAAYPKMSIQHVKEAILESASKDFYVDHSKFYRKQQLEGIFVYSTPTAPDLSSLNTEGYRVRAQAFKPENFGQGVLDIEAALRYAELRNLHPRKSKMEIKDLLNKTGALRQKMAAQTIQKAIRKWKVQKSARQKRLNGGTKRLSSMEKDNSLT